MLNKPAVSHHSTKRSRNRLMKLEQRVLFDGAGMVDAMAAVESTMAPTPMDAPADTPSQIAFVDATLPDADAIAAGFGPDTEVVMLQPASDPWQQITDTLSTRAAVSAIHLVSHGDEQTLIIAGQSYGAAQLETRSALLQSWREHLTADADLLLYGCKVGAGETAASLLKVLADATGADVAASTDATAPTALGGNTTLEVATGTIETTTAALTGLQHALAATTVSDANAAATRTTSEDTEIAVTGLSIADTDTPASVTLRVQTTGGTARIDTLGSTTVMHTC